MKNTKLMAKPIKETPILEEKEASQFIKKMEAAEVVRVSKKERLEIKAGFDRLQMLAKF